MITPAGEDVLSGMLPGLEIRFKIGDNILVRRFPIRLGPGERLDDYINEIIEKICDEGFGTIEDRLSVRAKDVLEVRPYNCDFYGMERWHY